MISLTLLLLLLGGAADGVDIVAERERAVANFLNERADWHPMCLYTFDDAAIGNGSTVKNWVPGDECPFGDLRPDDDLVTSLNAAATFWQLGVHLAADPQNDTTRTQLSSVSSVSARDFFTMAAVRNDTLDAAGVTFEMVLRRRAETNRSMTLFSIGNEFDACIDPGFRLDVNEHQVLVFIYFLPMLEDHGEAGMEACYEQRLFSVDSSAVCRLPPLLDPVERTPPVQIKVTLDPSSGGGLWKTDFYLSYTDIETMQRVDCVVHDEQHPPNTQVLSDLVKGRYRLFLGNSPRNVTHPRERRKLAPARDFRGLVHSNNQLNATEQLRAMLKQKLMSIRGPRLPKAMRIFGDSSVSLRVLGITFPPLNDDTPLAYLRSKLTDFKETYGDQIVDYLVDLIQAKVKAPVVAQQPHRPSGQGRVGQGSNDEVEISRTALFQGANGATFDLFHFSIYRRVVSKEQMAAATRLWLLPSRQVPLRQQTVRIPEDSLLLLNLSMVHSVFNDLRLELRSIPEVGQLMLYPSKAVVTSRNMNAFRELPLEYQRSIFFQPEPDQNNDNLPLPNAVAFSRRMKPYASIGLGIADSLAGRAVNRSDVVQIDIFVDAINDAPRPQNVEIEVRVEKGIPVALDLSGEDIDGMPSATSIGTDSKNMSDLLSSFIFSSTTAPLVGKQWLKIERLPQFGELFDCSRNCGELLFKRAQRLQNLKSARIYRNTTESRNATHSTSLLYIFHDWGHVHLTQNGSTAFVVDELRYRLSDGDPSTLSDIAVVKFVLTNSSTEIDGICGHSRSSDELMVVQLQEDSLEVVNLGELDPLAAISSYRTQLKVTKLPQQGTLYQYRPHNGAAGNDGVTANTTGLTNNSSLVFVGRRISEASNVVEDVLGRLIYVPKLNYFNHPPQPSCNRFSDADSFEYRARHVTMPWNETIAVHENSLTARFADGWKTRRVLLEVINTPDDLVVLPPIIFTANASKDNIISTPVAFENPDSLNPSDLYQVNIQAINGELELGFVITDGDIMTECPLERPCTLNRSVNGSQLNVSRSSDQTSVLQFHITSQLYDASHIQVSGTKAALSKALLGLTFRDVSGFSPTTTHTTYFTLWAKHASGDAGNSDDLQQTKGTFTIIVPANTQNIPTSGYNLLTAFGPQLNRYVWTLIVMTAGWFVLKNASCFSAGFCCCCCGKARRKRRKNFEERQRCFQAQVAQNNREYSTLLASLANLLLEPNLLTSLSLLECCSGFNRSQTKVEILAEAFCLRSLMPLLESERQGARFVFQLMVSEYADGTADRRSGKSIFHRQKFLAKYSSASRALAYFSRWVGSKWFTTLLARDDEGSSAFRGHPSSVLESLLDRLAKQVTSLPVEIVVLCRACAKLLLSKNDKSERRHEVELDAVHLVFFNHFLGPALVYDALGFASLTKQQERNVRGVAFRIVQFSDQWSSSSSKAPTSHLLSRCDSSDSLLGAFAAANGDSEVYQRKYQALLDIIAHSPTMASSYDASDVSVDMDSALMGACLMNLHSVLDSNFLPFGQRLTQVETEDEPGGDRLVRATRLLKALGFPLADVQQLVQYSQSELESDPLLWNDWSFQGWTKRAANCQVQKTAEKAPRPRSILVTKPDEAEFVLEQDDNKSPQDVDWLTS